MTQEQYNNFMNNKYQQPPAVIIKDNNTHSFASYFVSGLGGGLGAGVGFGLADGLMESFF